MNLEQGLTNIRLKTTPLLHEYAGRLNKNKESLENFDAVTESLIDILKKAKSMEWDKNGSKLENSKVAVPESFDRIIKELVVENNLYAIFTPEEFGGHGYSTVFVPPVVEMISYADLSLSTAVLISLAVLEPLYHHPKNEYFREVISDFSEGKRTGYVAFTEPEAGSNLENVSSTSKKEGKGYILNGTKIFISNGGYANTGLFLAKNVEKGEQNGHNVFLLDNLNDIKIERLEEKMGLHADPTAQLRVENLFVEKDHLIGKEGEGYKNVLTRLMSMRLGVSVQAVGSAQRAYDLANSYAENRIQFRKPINTFDGVKRKLTAMESQIPLMRVMSYRGALALDRYQNGRVPHDMQEGKSEAFMSKMMLSQIKLGIANYYVSSAKIYCSEIAKEIADQALQIHGGNGFISEVEANKIYRDVRILPIYEGTSEIQEWIINKTKEALKFAPKIKPFLRDEKTIYEKKFLLDFPSLETIL